MKTRLNLLISLLLAVGLILSACGAPAAAPATESNTTNAAADAVPADVPQELRVASPFFSGQAGGDMAELDPPRRGTWSFHSLLWAPLVWGDTAGNPNPEKSLARSWEISEDGTVYTFHLRPDAVYSDGTPITARDVVLDFGHYAMLMHPEARGYRDNFGTGRRLYFDIVGFMEFLDDNPYEEFGTGEEGAIPGIVALDDHTVEITLEQPAENFIRRLAAAFAVFKPEDLWAGADAEYDLLDYWTTKAAASGPYKISEAVPGESYTMVPNENYFGPKPTIEKITVLHVSDDVNTILTAFGNQELDMVNFAITGDFARQAYGDAILNPQLVEIPTWIVEQFWVTPNVPLDDVHVRRAFSMAIDKDTLIKILNAGAELPLHRRVNMHRNPGVPHCVEETAAVTALPFDPEAAKAELEQSEYYPDVLDMEIHMLSRRPDQLVQLEAVQKMLQDNLGLTNITIHTEEVADMMNPPFPLHLWLNNQQPWYADITDTLRNMAFFIRDEPWQPDEHRAFVDTAYIPELRTTVEESITETDPAVRCELIAKAGQIWNDEVFSLDFGIPVAYYLIAPWVQGELEWYQNAGQGKPLNIEDWSIGAR
ncbi:ABC transporter substrate-binding protein [Chloroflexi bacterium TSY]|nr:ABC transporter substrate-binding protein [Chloroflexi bacterium TSY]